MQVMPRGTKRQGALIFFSLDEVQSTSLKFEGF